MAEIKRVSDQYKISAPSIVLDGNLVITGTSTSLETINSVIKDNIIVLNDGEVGDGVTQGTSGIEVERGSLDNATLLFNESSDVWEAKIGTSFSIVRGATPVNPNDLVTKEYVDLAVENIEPSDPINSVQFNDNGSFAGSSNFVYNGTELLIDDISLTSNTISTISTNLDLELASNGTGKVYIRNAIKLENELVDPTFQSGHNIIFAKVPDTAGSGLFFTNSLTSDELVSKKKSILFGLIF